MAPRFYVPIKCLGSRCDKVEKSVNRLNLGGGANNEKR